MATSLLRQKTSRRRFDVIMALLLRLVPIGDVRRKSSHTLCVVWLITNSLSSYIHLSSNIYVATSRNLHTYHPSSISESYFQCAYLSISVSMYIFPSYISRLFSVSVLYLSSPLPPVYTLIYLNPLPCSICPSLSYTISVLSFLSQSFYPPNHPLTPTPIHYFLLYLSLYTLYIPATFIIFLLYVYIALFYGYIHIIYINSLSCSVLDLYLSLYHLSPYLNSYFHSLSIYVSLSPSVLSIIPIILFISRPTFPSPSVYVYMWTLLPEVGISDRDK